MGVNPISTSVILPFFLLCAACSDTESPNQADSLPSGGSTLACRGDLGCPVSGRTVHVGFGERTDRGVHLAYDIDGAVGDPMLAGCTGPVVFAGEIGGYGSYAGARGPVTVQQCEIGGTSIVVLYGHCVASVGVGENVASSIPICELAEFLGPSAQDWSHLHWGCRLGQYGDGGNYFVGYADGNEATAESAGEWVDCASWQHNTQMSPPINIPSDFDQIHSDAGVTMWRRTGSAGDEIITEIETGRVRMANIADVVSTGENGTVRSHRHLELWDLAASEARPGEELQVLLSGTFASFEPVTGIAFGLKKQGTTVSLGYEISRRPEGEVLVLRWNEMATELGIEPHQHSIFDGNTYSEVLGGLHPNAGIRANSRVGRTMVGTIDADGDGVHERLVFYAAKTMTQADAAQRVRDLGADQVVMFDGSGSTEVVLLGQSFFNIDRRAVPDAVAIYVSRPIGTPPQVSVSPLGDVVRGNIVSVTWSASDDEGVRARDGISVALYRGTCGLGDAGRVRDLAPALPGDARTHSWMVSSNEAVGSDYFVKVAAVDDGGSWGYGCSASFSIRDGDTEAPAITVSSPNGGSFTQGDRVGIAWTASDNVEIRATDGFVISLYQGTCGTGSAGLIRDLRQNLSGSARSDEWIIPTNVGPGSGYRIKVAGIDNAGNWGHGCSRDFTINGPDMQPPAVAISSPNGGSFAQGDRLSIAWSASDNVAVRSTGGQVISLHQGTCGTGSAGLIQDIATNVGGATRTHDWNIPSNFAIGGNYQVKIAAVDDAGNWGYACSSTFSITAPADLVAPVVSISAPSGGSYAQSSSMQMSWTSTDNVAVRSANGQVISLHQNACSTGNTGLVQHISQNVSGSTQSYNWSIPSNIATGGNYQIKIAAVDDAGNWGYACSPAFTITAPPDTQAPTVSVTSPSGGNYMVGTNVPINWTASDNVGIRALDGQVVSLHQGTCGSGNAGLVQNIAQSVAGATRSLTWAVGSTVPAGRNYQIKVSAVDDAGNWGYSCSAAFIIYTITANYTGTFSPAGACMPANSQALYQGRASMIAGNQATMVFQKCDQSPQSSGRTYWIAVGEQYPQPANLGVYVTRTNGSWSGGTSLTVGGINIWPSTAALDADPCDEVKNIFIITDGTGNNGQRIWYQYEAVQYRKFCN